MAFKTVALSFYVQCENIRKHPHHPLPQLKIPNNEQTKHNKNIPKVILKQDYQSGRLCVGVFHYTRSEDTLC